MNLDLAWLPWIWAGAIAAFFIIGYLWQFISFWIWPPPPDDTTF